MKPAAATRGTVLWDPVPLAHGFNRDCQSLLVDDVHLLADTQGCG